MMRLTPEETATDMLINAQPRVGGRVGVGDDAGVKWLRDNGFIGPSNCLTKAGVSAAKKAQHEYWGGPE